MNQPYQPINCSFYDELEILAMRKRKVTVEFRDEDNQDTSAEDVIVDVYSRNKEEFLKLRGGQIIRLDRLIRVDGKSLPGSCELSKE
jgi:Rho-binding antiterminator